MEWYVKYITKSDKPYSRTKNTIVSADTYQGAIDKAREQDSDFGYVIFVEGSKHENGAKPE